MYDIEQVINVATVTKLTRNLFIIGIIPFVSYLYYKNVNNNGELKQQHKLPKWYTFIPGFVIIFLLFVLLRTIGDMTVENLGLAFGFIKEATWMKAYNTISSFGTTYLLGMAMAGVGLATDFSKFKGIGIKPFYIGFIAAVSVGFVSIVLISLFGHFF